MCVSIIAFICCHFGLWWIWLSVYRL